MSRNPPTPTRIVPVQPNRPKAVEAAQESGNLLTPR